MVGTAPQPPHKFSYRKLISFFSPRKAECRFHYLCKRIQHFLVLFPPLKKQHIHL